MRFDLGPKAASFLDDVREFLDAHMNDTIAEQARSTGFLHDWDLHKAFAERGWLAASWPVELGGQGRSALEMAAFGEELVRRGVPAEGLSTTSMVASTLRELGSDYHRRELLPRILAGDVLVSLGYSEPDAGSDVAAATTRAVQDGHEWVINGQKIFTSLAQGAQYVFLLTRTNPDAPKHKGLTMFLVPLDDPHVEIREIGTLGGERTNMTFYTDVRVPDDARVGPVDGGWKVMNIALAFERAASYGTAVEELLRAALEAAEPARSAGPLSSLVRQRLGETAVLAEVATLLDRRAIIATEAGNDATVAASMSKLFATESLQRCAGELMDAIGVQAVLQDDGPAQALERIHRDAQAATIWAGTSEIQRDIIAQRGLGLPRSR